MWRGMTFASLCADIRPIAKPVGAAVVHRERAISPLATVVQGGPCIRLLAREHRAAGHERKPALRRPRSLPHKVNNSTMISV